ncbi:TonB-dependent receptor [uncultured Winogradskyella sp.]|uniref:SusC/RagA family TonB-linked outer membrane protein n=1 Tax=uncultured Winogradskyella sp. TaxID=395353 RepID=UPI002622B3AE|nr:TonB-dependent receptor [uncultured Winogradskyella sp.]
MKTFLNAILLCVFLVPATLFAQSTVTGTVTDGSNSMPLPGVNVIVKGTTNGNNTDFDGKYSLTVNNGDVIVFSYLGFVTQEITYNGQATIDVTLTEDAAQLDEIVLIGYGSTTKQDATGAVDKVSDDDFNRGAIVAPEQLLAGKSAGVRITTNGGAAGEGSQIRIRGISSLSANQSPLIVVDGLPLDQRGVQGVRNALNAINPADIKDFVVLKDASATAIYGSRASNGVILITTKKGQSNSPWKVEYDLKASSQQVNNTVDVLSADQYRNLANVSTAFDPSLTGNANTDWQDEIYQTALSAIHNITVSKGYENFNFRVNLNHVTQQGTLRTDLYERNAINTAFEQRLLDNDLKLTLTAKGIIDEYSFANQGAIGAAVSFDPSQPIFDQNGNFTELGANLAPRNPVSLLENDQNNNRSKRLISNFNIDYKFWFLKDLRFNLNAGIDYAENNGKQFNIANPNNPGAFPFQNFYSGLNRNTSLDFYLNYKKNVESINTVLDITAGHSYQEFYVASDQTLTGASGGLITNPVIINRNGLESYFARASFDHDDKYLLSLSYRADISSRFSPDNRTGYFPGASFGWKISNEDFMENSFFSNLKLRGGWGITGNQEIGNNYAYLGIYSPAVNDQVSALINGQLVPTLRPNGFDENLKWEETSQYNLALDFGLFDNRLSGSVDVYYKETKDLLAQVPVPAGSNLTDQIITNVGELTSKGIELNLDGKIIQNDNFNWDSNFNVTFQDIEVENLSLVDNPDFVIPTGGISGGTGNTIQILRPGFDPTTFFVFRQVYDTDGNPIEGAYVDVNGDNQITTADRQPYKKATPDAFIGFTNNFTYKSFDLSFTFRGSFGNYVYNNVSSSNGTLATAINAPGAFQPNVHASYLDTGFANPQLFSDYYVRRADFVRLDNLSIGYQLPFENVQVRASITGSNLFVITDYEGLDPEISNGIDNNFYPRARSFVFGLNFIF